MITKFEIQKCDRTNSFALWQVKMHAILTQQKLQKALLGKEKMSDSLTAEQKEEIDDKALTAIQLYLSDEVLREVLDEKTAAGLCVRPQECRNATKFGVLDSRLRDEDSEPKIAIFGAADFRDAVPQVPASTIGVSARSPRRSVGSRRDLVHWIRDFERNPQSPHLQFLVKLGVGLATGLGDPRLIQQSPF
uniref:Uncharacterized protein n=1 Tax=Ananas comosus var. bracteatus TaxID=296719 RepID=A0A6V7P9U0_ANACO|nr:unnamed protein product [Ananas comosus var. bracteatus]